MNNNILHSKSSAPDYSIIGKEILAIAPQFGFLEAKVAQIKIDINTQTNFTNWLAQKFHGDMAYLGKNTNLRFNPELLHDGTLSIICVKAPYLSAGVGTHIKRLHSQENAYISSYALGRDYHKVLKSKLNEYARWINQHITQYKIDFDYRVFTDSAPILEVELAQNSGLGWRGKNTLLLNKNQGSMFFLGEIFTNLPLAPKPTMLTKTNSNHCGTCTKCMEACPTKAFVAQYVLDATKCISYLTIENKGSIPVEFRKAIGNRIYGCDDCQLFCPWNKFSQLTTLDDFNVRHNLDHVTLVEAFAWNENIWKTKMQGSSIYRIGYTSWLRNVAVALGNAKTTTEIITALKAKLNYPNELVKEHVIWALTEHFQAINNKNDN